MKDSWKQSTMTFFPVDSSGSDSSDDDPSVNLDIDLLIIMATAMRAYLVMMESFEAIELSWGNQSSVIHGLPVNDLLTRHIGHSQQFKDITTFTPGEFEELCGLVCPLLQTNARSTRRQHTVSGLPCKLPPNQRLMSFILYLKHDNTVNFDASRWNWCRATVCDDALFVATVVNEAIADEICWPSQEERRVLGQKIPQFPGCIGMVDGTLVKIIRPFENPRHRKWYQGQKKMYCMNSSVLVDHNGLFIFTDAGYPGSYHDCSILQNLWVEANHWNLFVNTPEYCEYVLGDSGYKSMEHYVLWGYSRTEMRSMRLHEGPSGHLIKCTQGIKCKSNGA